jgi:hypothetical protein
MSDAELSSCFACFLLCAAVRRYQGPLIDCGNKAPGAACDAEARCPDPSVAPLSCEVASSTELPVYRLRVLTADPADKLCKCGVVAVVNSGAGQILECVAVCPV